MSFTITDTPQELYVEVSVLNSLPMEITAGNIIRCRVAGRSCNNCGYLDLNRGCYDKRKRDSDKIFAIIKNKYPELLL